MLYTVVKIHRVLAIFYPSPKMDMLRGARKGRTVLSGVPSALHLTVVGGHTARGQGAGGGQD